MCSNVAATNAPRLFAVTEPSAAVSPFLWWILSEMLTHDPWDTPLKCLWNQKQASSVLPTLNFSLFNVSLFGIAFNLDFHSDPFSLSCVFRYPARGMFPPGINVKATAQRKGTGRKHARWKHSERQISDEAEFHLSLNKQPCLSVVCIGGAERGPALPRLQLFLISAAQRGIRGWERQRAPTDWGRGGGGERAGLREFAGSLVYSVVVLTSEWTPADTGPWRLAHVDVEEL